MSANMDVTMAVHFDVPNVDYELPSSQNINRKICSCVAKPTNVVPRRNPDPGALDEG